MYSIYIVYILTVGYTGLIFEIWKEKLCLFFWVPKTITELKITFFCIFPKIQ